MITLKATLLKKEKKSYFYIVRLPFTYREPSLVDMDSRALLISFRQRKKEDIM